MKKTILYALAACMIIGLFFTYSTSKKNTDNSKLSNVIQESKKYSSATTSPYDKSDVSDTTGTPTSSSETPEASSTAVSSPAPTVKPTWIETNNNNIIEIDSDIFEKGTYNGEYIFATYNNIGKTIVRKLEKHLTPTAKNIASQGGPAIYTLKIIGSSVESINIYGKYNDQWECVLSLDFCQILEISDFELSECVPALEYGKNRYQFYAISHNKMYLLDNNNEDALCESIIHHQVSSIIHNQTMLNYALTPVFANETDIYQVRFILDSEKEAVINLPQNKTIFSIKKITAMKDRLVFSFTDGTHYISPLIYNNRAGIYNLTEELVELKNWDIKDIEAATDEDNRLFIRLYDNTIYYYDIE